MTITRSSTTIRAELTENTKAFNMAREDATLFQRLQGAVAEAAKLQARDEALRAELLRAEEHEAKARKEATYANIRNMRVETVRSGGYAASDSVLAHLYRIRFERSAYNSTTHRNEWVSAEVDGFATLTPDQFGYLIEKAPDQIPAGIMNLAPGDPVEAFRVYSLGMRRGFLSA